MKGLNTEERKDEPERSSAPAKMSVFLTCPLDFFNLKHQVPNQRTQHAANQRSYNRNPTISPIRVAFASDGEELMGNTRTEVTGRIDGIPCGATQ